MKNLKLYRQEQKFIHQIQENQIQHSVHLSRIACVETLQSMQFIMIFQTVNLLMLQTDHLMTLKIKLL